MAIRNYAQPWLQELGLDSAAGEHISNVQSMEPVPNNVMAALDASFSAKYPSIRRRTVRPTAVYNCHGLAFASRRTQIDDAKEVRRLLREDSYRQVQPDDVMPGDLLLYVMPEGAIDHSAIVIERGNLGVHKVVSKWSLWLEVIHWSNECPYAHEPDVRLEYHRIEY